MAKNLLFAIVFVVSILANSFSSVHQNLDKEPLDAIVAISNSSIVDIGPTSTSDSGNEFVFFDLCLDCQCHGTHCFLPQSDLRILDILDNNSKYVMPFRIIVESVKSIHRPPIAIL